MNPCASNPCGEQQICLLSSTEPSGHTCPCIDGYSVVNVLNRTECRASDSIVCSLFCNQGRCHVVNEQPKCHCPPDFEGTYCETYRCNGYCKNRGTCYVDRSFKLTGEMRAPLKCYCPDHWTGARCETPIAECGEPCQNGGTCANADTCVCLAGYRGEHCEQCDDLQCENDGVCRKDKLGRLLALEYRNRCWHRTII